MPALRGERTPLVGTADEKADHAFGNARPVEAVDQEGAARRSLFRRFENDRVAGDQRRDDVTVGKMRGEVIGPEDRENAVRLMADGDTVAERRLELPLRSALCISVDGNLDLVDDGGDLGAGFPQRLAGLAGDQLGEFGLALAHDVGEAAQRFHPVGDGECGPFRPGGAGNRHFGSSISDAAAPKLFAGRRRSRHELGRRRHALRQLVALLSLAVHRPSSRLPSCGSH